MVWDQRIESFGWNVLLGGQGVVVRGWFLGGAWRSVNKPPLRLLTSRGHEKWNRLVKTSTGDGDECEWIGNRHSTL